MRAVIQRVKSSSLCIDGSEYSSIGEGLLVLIGITDDDEGADIDYIVKKVLNLRLFDDENGVMNLSAAETEKEIMVVSQFTLFGDARKGRRPSYIKAARPEISVPIYEKTLEEFKKSGLVIKNGVFGADMQISLVNDGPVTILLDSKKLF